MDHVGSLDPQKINQAVTDYRKFCEDNHVSITDMKDYGIACQLVLKEKIFEIMRAN
jgi:hypothetical protein